MKVGAAHDGSALTFLPPGTNRKGGVSGGGWVFLLPSLELRRTLCLGWPSAPTLSTLARISDEVVVLDSRSRQRATLHRVIHRQRWRALEAPVVAGRTLPEAGSVDLIYVATKQALRRFVHQSGFHAALDAVLAANGRLYLQLETSPDRLTEPLPPGVTPGDLLWLLNVGREVRAVAPLADDRAIAYLSGISAPPKPRSWPSALAGLLRSGSTRRRTISVGALRARTPTAEASRVPEYVLHAAERQAVRLERHRWALLAPRAYRTKKVIGFLFPPDGSQPEYAVKLTQAAEFNSRLENEWDALSRLHELELKAAGVVPRPLFLDHHGGVAVLAQRAVSGVPFRKATSGRPDCPAAAAVVDWLVDFARASANTEVSAGHVSGRIDALLERFTATYRPAPVHRAFLASRLAAFREIPGPVPLSFEHGDCGVWNVLIDGEGRPVFLDWEAFERRGMPLWDIFYFMRSYGILAARREGIHDAHAAFARHYFEVSDFSRMLARGMERFFTTTGLPAELVEPLFYACWMHRSLKEASSLPPRRLDRGHYVSLLQRCIERRNSPGLRFLFDRVGAERTTDVALDHGKPHV